MSDTPAEYGFETPHPIRLFVENGSGTVALQATSSATTQVHIAGRNADQVVVRQDGEEISVVAPKPRASGLFGGDQKLDIEVTMPSTSAVVVKSGSADVSATGRLGATKIKCGSGDVELDELGGVAVVDTGSGDIRIQEAASELRIRSGSGDVEIDTAAATTAISTGSGDVRLGRVGGPVVVKTGSGDLEITDAEGDVAMTTGSGDTVIRTARRGRISSKGASGSVQVGIPAGTPVWTDVKTVTGSLRSSIEGVGEPEPGADHVELRATTVSGDVVLAPV
jgi:DUF4097 and DUF4098 domain-containing protein YvlB